MEFFNKDALLLLLILPLFLWVYIYRVKIRSRRLQQILGKNSLFLTNSVSNSARIIKFVLIFMACVFFILALARPQWIGQKAETKRTGVYMLLAIDISASMLAEDIKPSRLSFLKRELTRFVDISKEDKIAIVAFAGSAVLISPFTEDLSIVKLYLKDLTPSYLSTTGSNFRQLFPQIDRAFKGLKNKAETAEKIVILASDGEDHDEMSLSSVYSLEKQGIRFFTLSFGTKEGGVIPIKNRERRTVGYKRNTDNEVVVTKLKTKTLKKLARMTKGAYYHVTYDGKAINSLRADIDGLEKTVFDRKSGYKKKELYQWFLILGLFLAFLELWLSEGRIQKPQTAPFSEY